MFDCRSIKCDAPHTFIRSPHILNIIPRRFIYSAVGSSVGLLVTGLYRKIFVGLLGSSFGEEYDAPAGMLNRVRNNFPASLARKLQHGGRKASQQSSL